MTYEILGIIFYTEQCLNESVSNEIAVTHSCNKISLYQIMLIISMAPKTMVDFTNCKDVADFTVVPEKPSFVLRLRVTNTFACN